MNQQQNNINSGALFVNQKIRGQSSPQLIGRINVAGREYWISAWRKIARAGVRQGQSYYSLSVREQDQYQQNQQNNSQNPPQYQNQQPGYQEQAPPDILQQEPFIDDDIPF